MPPPAAQGSRQDAARIAELTSALASWSPQRGEALSWVLPAVREAVGAHFAGAYLVGSTEAGWKLHFMHGAGPSATANVSAFQSLVAREPPSLTFLRYNPLAIPTRERNRALSLAQLVRLQRHPGSRPVDYNRLYDAVGLLGQDQLRVFLCRGPSMLAWVGVTREAPFGRREGALLQRLTGPLRRRLLVEREVLAPGLQATLLDAALEAVGYPAFVVTATGGIELANAAGVELLARDRRAAQAAIAACRQRPDGDAGSVTGLAVDGWPARQLVVLRAPDPSQGERLVLARRRFDLSPAQARVLAPLIEGWSNKEIAQQLACAVVTVENHVTELLRRAQARSRADLVRRVFLLR